MNVYTAIMKVADLIERRPQLFGFMEVRVPPCGSPGCLIGLIAASLGVQEGGSVEDVAQQVMGIEAKEFYQRMTRIWVAEELTLVGEWTEDAGIAAMCLRLYAEKYHGDNKPKHEGIPASVRQIFERVSA